MAQGMKKCPFCGAEVKKTNFNRHLRKVHGELEEEEFKKEGIAKPITAKSKLKQEREEKKKTEIRKRVKKRQANRIAVIVALIIIISVVGVIVYQNFISKDGGGSGVINGGGNPVAIMSTSLGTIKIELYENKAPKTAGNFINLAKSRFYNGVIFHRVVSNFVIQGGGFLTDGSQKSASQIPWEDTGYKNLKYTIAMARSGDPNTQEGSGTATSQFFINLKDNDGLDSYTYPFVVFGKVIDGFSVVDAIGNLPTGTHNGMNDWPDNPPVINSVIIQE